MHLISIFNPSICLILIAAKWANVIQKPKQWLNAELDLIQECKPAYVDEEYILAR